MHIKYLGIIVLNHATYGEERGGDGEKIGVCEVTYESLQRATISIIRESYQFCAGQIV